MTAPAYETDLTLFNLAENTGTYSEFTNMVAGGTPDMTDTDDPIQGTYMVSQTGKISAAALGSISCDYGSGVTVPTDGAFLIWSKFDAGGILETYANGGVRAVVGSAIGVWKAWKVGGKDVSPNPYGGWKNYAIDPTLTADYTYGAPSTPMTLRFAGMAFVLTATGPTRGSPHKLDAIRFGRCEARIRYGATADGYATFTGFAAVNDVYTARWGLIQAVAGGFLWKGLMTLGYTNAVDFRDSNTSIFIDDTRKVSANFNKIEIRQASSRVDWTNISFVCTNPTTTASKGMLEVIDDADVNISYCVFTDMDTFIFKAASAILSCTFRRCNTITANDADFSGTLFDAASVAADTSQLVWDVATDPNNDTDGCTFVKGANAHHAIEFGLNSPTSITLTNVIFTGFNASNAQNDSALHIKRTAGTVTITITGGTVPSYKSAGATVVLVTSSRTIKAIAQKADGTRVGSARILLRTAAAASGGFPYNVTVTITNSSTTATVSHTAHGMLTNDKIQISGASLTANNGVFAITKINDDSYSYTMGSSPGTNPTGTIKATFVFLEGAADSGTGELSMSRAIGANQSVTGWARKAADLLKQGPLSGTVITTGDSTFTAILSVDS